MFINQKLRGVLYFLVIFTTLFLLQSLENIYLKNSSVEEIGRRDGRRRKESVFRPQKQRSKITIAVIKMAQSIIQGDTGIHDYFYFFILF